MMNQRIWKIARGIMTGTLVSYGVLVIFRGRTMEVNPWCWAITAWCAGLLIWTAKD